MNDDILQALKKISSAHKESNKPLAVILAGHNGSGKSTYWYEHLADKFQVPLINADRIMMSVLPEVIVGQQLPTWASNIRDQDPIWMEVAQKNVEAFVAHAMARQVPFAMETVFSHWNQTVDGRIESKIDLIRQMQDVGYYVLLLFVGLTNYQLSIARVSTRVKMGGHGVKTEKLIARFPRTQKAVKQAVSVADAAILTDNSRAAKYAFTVCRIQMGEEEIYDCRNMNKQPPFEVLEWLNIVSPQET